MYLTLICKERPVACCLVCRWSSYLTKPAWGGNDSSWIDAPPRKMPDFCLQLCLTLRKSLWPIRFPAVSAETSWVTMVSGPTCFRIYNRRQEKYQIQLAKKKKKNLDCRTELQIDLCYERSSSNRIHFLFVQMYRMMSMNYGFNQKSADR